MMIGELLAHLKEKRALKACFCVEAEMFLPHSQKG